MKLRAVIFDWAGTVVDHGSRAPVATLLDVFAIAQVPITAAEARLAMGIAKKDHIRSILELPRIRTEWKNVHGAEPRESDVDALYAQFIPKQLECLAEHSDVIAGVPEAVERMRARGIRIGSTTGYTRPMLDRLLDLARHQGFSPDAAFCPDDVPGGRPAPWMCFANAMRLGVYPMWKIVKIGDTPNDIEEGQNAGMWTIGITRCGNEVGLTRAEWDAATEEQQRELMDAARARLLAAGAHCVAPSVAECDAFLDSIEYAIAAGRRP